MEGRGDGGGRWGRWKGKVEEGRWKGKVDGGGERGRRRGELRDHSRIATGANQLSDGVESLRWGAMRR
jgi:hypothetical protein